jgi:uncharacterized protein YndB with AHSA1/START domain
MEQKTKIEAPEGKQEILITRIFDLPLELLFKAYEEPELVSEWMGTNVVKLENHDHGSYEFITTDTQGNKHRFHGTIHEFKKNHRIIRTFEMANTPFPVQLEFLEFEEINEESSLLKMLVVYKSEQTRNDMLKLPFAFGINMAHNRLQELSFHKK